MIATKEQIIKGRKVVLKKALKYAKENNEDLIEFLKETIEIKRDDKQKIPKGLRKMIRTLEKKPILLTKATFDQKLWAIEFYRDMEMWDTDFEELLLNQFLVKPEYIYNQEWEPKPQEWELVKKELLAEDRFETRTEKVKASDHQLDKAFIITDTKMKNVKKQKG